MKPFFFTIVLHKTTKRASNLEDSLFEAGCSDALICRYNDTIYLEFDRNSPNAEMAISSALDEIKQAGFTPASIIEGGVASMSEIASRAKLTRAAVNNYSKSVRGPGDFPEPLFGLASGSPLYSWPAVALWLHQQGKVDHSLVAVSQAAQQLTPELVTPNPHH